MAMGGHVYMLTNEVRSAVAHYVRTPQGTITEVERCLTGGAGAGPLNYRSNPMGVIVEGAQRAPLARSEPPVRSQPGR